jgi:uncharacterized protein (DUF1697 family)
MRTSDPLIRYIAFLGGINVGGHRLKMDRLRGLFQEMDFSNVSTFIASGNVLFSASSDDTVSLETTIERHLEDSLGYGVPAFIRTPAELEPVAAYQPFPAGQVEAPNHTLRVCFLRRALVSSEAAALLAFRTEKDDLHVRGREFYWLCRGKTADSLINWRSAGKKLAIPFTARSITMLRKLSAAEPQVHEG